MNPNPVRVVFDTSVIISHVLRPGSIPSQALLLAQRQMEILISEATLEELATVLLRPKFAPYIMQEDVVTLLHDIAQGAELISITTAINACRDPKDNKFLELAVNGLANYIVTGDEDLLVLNPFQSIKIITSRIFLEKKS